MAGSWRGRFNHANHGPLRQRCWRDVRPCLAVVPGQVDQAVVRASPEDPRLMGRFDKSKDRGIVLGTGGVARDGATRWPKLGDVVPRQVRSDGLPTGTLVRGAKDDVARGIEHVRVVRGEDDGIRPLEAIFEVSGAPTAVGFGPDRDNAHLPVAVVIA